MYSCGSADVPELMWGPSLVLGWYNPFYFSGAIQGKKEHSWIGILQRLI